jgi:hypothetical protein
MEIKRNLSPEVATSLASAVSLYMIGKYPADDRVLLKTTSKSIIINEGVGGKPVTYSIPRSLLGECISDLRVKEPSLYQWLDEGIKGRMKKLYAWRFYAALTALWDLVEGRLESYGE